MKIFFIKRTPVLIAAIFIAAITTVKASASNPEESGTEKTGYHIHYMGNIEGGNMFPWEGFMKDSSGMASLTTTHGVVIKPWLYTGLGTGFWFLYSHDGIAGALPIFADVRFTYPNKRWRPFVDLKIGSFLSGNIISEYFLLIPSVGIKFAIKDTFGVYLSAGTMGHFAKDMPARVSEGLSLNLGFDF